MNLNRLLDHAYLIPLLPLLGAVISGFLGARVLKGKSHWPIWLGVGAAAVISILILVKMLAESHHVEETIGFTRTWFEWISVANFRADAAVWIDPLSAVMLCVVTGIGFFITVFAAGYMKGEEGYFRFFAYLGLFIFMMTILVMGNNLLMLYLGWEGVGLCSYLLIGYYYDKPSAREAAKKAFLVNRVGDFGFGLGIMLSFLAFGTITYFDGGAGLLELAAKPQADLTPFQAMAMQWIPFLLMLGAFGKSAQFPLYVWLPDAMEGPTPVSALIHAATMVTAGVYMIGRCSTLFVTNAAACNTIAAIGAFTAIFAASIALRQVDLKKVFAYSTISQLGFMFVAMGVLAPVAGVFHLVTHAFFKALLFLSSGVVMHAMAGELDMMKMSGLKKVLPWTNRLMLVGCLALAGFPLLSGFFSKDEIVAAALDRSVLLGVVMLVTAFMTAYYTFRLYFRVFQGPLVVPAKPQADGHGHGHDDHGGHHNHEPAIMILPLIVLAIGALVVGYINWPERHNSLAGFLGKSPSFASGYALAMSNPVLPVEAHTWGQPEPVVPHHVAEGTEIAEDEHHVSFAFSWVMYLSAIIAVLGIWVAYLIHLRDRTRAERMAREFAPAVRVLDGKYWVDELYQAAIVEPLRDLGKAFFMVDRIVVDGIVWLISFIPQLSGFVLKLTVQRGSLQGYAAAMLLGIVVILIAIFLG